VILLLYRAANRSVDRLMPSPTPPPPNSLIRPRDRRTISAFLAAVLALMAAGWWRHGGDGGTIDIDRAAPLTASFQVNVNRADWPELMQLPGVGRTLAERLIAEREVRGAFRSVEDLARVDGIGPRTIERIRPYLLPMSDEAEIASR
jgi:competence protein ComEA